MFSWCSGTSAWVRSGGGHGSWRRYHAGEVLCHAKVIHHGGRTLVVEAEVRQGDTLVARAQGTFMLV